MQIRKYAESDREAVVALSLRAWEPVFRSIERTLSPELYRQFYPDWRISQQQAVEAACAELAAHTWVAEDDGAVAGFVAVKLHPDRMGEIHMVAVDPAHQRRGIAGRLTEFALAAMKELGMTVAMVETGADAGHAPARRTYERSGFELWPTARYFKKL
jgi:ribosomal protein S18 acetylase RimI-like enzyme